MRSLGADPLGLPPSDPLGSRSSRGSKRWRAPAPSFEITDHAPPPHSRGSNMALRRHPVPGRTAHHVRARASAAEVLNPAGGRGILVSAGRGERTAVRAGSTMSRCSAGCWELRDSLTSDDAAHVALAQARQVTLLTGDQRLARSLPRVPRRYGGWVTRVLVTHPPRRRTGRHKEGGYDSSSPRWTPTTGYIEDD